MWHHNLKFHTCPFNSKERDNRKCNGCIYQDKKNKVQNEKKVVVSRKIPKIGKTYTSE